MCWTERPRFWSTCTARMASSVMMPELSTVMSFPSETTRAFPNSMGVAKSRGISPRSMRTYTGPLIFSITPSTDSTSAASPQSRTVMFGSARMTATSSMAWWVAPPGVVMPGRKPIILTGRLG